MSITFPVCHNSPPPPLTPPPPVPQERLITNAGWKDYSSASGGGQLNYGYDAGFEMEENGINARRSNGSSMRPKGTYSKAAPANGSYAAYSANGGGSNGYHHHPNGYHANGNGYSGSLQRPRNGDLSRHPDPRAAYSLPRGNGNAHASASLPRGSSLSSSSGHSPPSYNTAMQDTPDFYYLPSQRKYSGEVVRVYVDYSQQQGK